MHQIRTFTNKNIEKVDNLIYYLNKNKLEYTFHWHGPTEKKAESIKDTNKTVFMARVTWFS